jgi:hypothetical protein
MKEGATLPRMGYREVSDAQFEKAVQDLVQQTGCDKHFYTKVAGASHLNLDRTSRTRIIGKCEVFETLEFRPEPNNEFDSNAIAIVRRKTDEQLGYLEADLATEVAKDFIEYGPCWIAVFCHPNYHPETDAIVGAVIYMLRLPVEKLAAEEANEQ